MKTPSGKRSQRSRRQKQQVKASIEGSGHFAGTAPRTASGFQQGAFQGDSAQGVVRGTTDHSIGVTYEAGAPEPVSIVPTVYPEGPGGVITGGQNHVTINLAIHGGDFRKFKGKIVDLSEALRGWNAISPEVRQQIIAETSAGMALLEAPKADRGLIDLLLIRPLKWLSTIAGAGERVAELALVALDLLNKMIG
jgi:hypothetical protein